MLKNTFNLAKSLLPRISETEMIALRAGTVSVDREIFKGRINSSFKLDINNTSLSPEHFFTDVKNTYQLIDQSPIYNGYNIPDVIKHLGVQGYFSFNIPQQYGGVDIPVETQSHLLTQMASHNPSLGVIVMVPNSLGPAELLLHYGTEQQKNTYLPRLASGDMIPCFGLTGPENGSDAGGKIDSGTVIEKDGKLYIRTSVNKRYITLAPIADLVGLAIKVSDPSGLLKRGKQGITVCLLERNHQNLKLETHHNPLNIGFPNGTIRGDIDIPIEQVIGGESNTGHGWKMLMECLAAGRGVSLPASALGSSLSCWHGISGYSNLRSQFNIPLSKMQGVQEKLARITFNSWTSLIAVKYTNRILDSGEKPSVVSAIMKQQITERGRLILNDSMDIYAGSAICIGPNNFIEKYYKAAPVGITVEGSNTLTRSLIIFGQGLNKSHPHISDIVTAIQNDNIDDYVKHMSKMINHTMSLYIKSVGNKINNTTNVVNQINVLTTNFANLSNIVAMMGGKLKKEQRLSGYMADYLSNLYLAASLLQHLSETKNTNLQKLDVFCIKNLINEIDMSQKAIFNELPIHLKLSALPSMKTYTHKLTSFDYETMARIMWDEPELRELIEKHIVMDDIHVKISNANTTQDNEEREKLIQDIIQVGEFENKKTHLLEE
jgi:acyl-CoA dehydrogenase